MDYDTGSNQASQDQKGVVIIGSQSNVPAVLGSSIDYDRLYKDQENKVFIEIISNELGNLSNE
jgi:hypothetical protein